MKFFVGALTVTMLCCFVFGGAGSASPVRKLDAEERPFEVFRSAEELNAYRAAHEGDFFNLSDEEYAMYDEAFFRGNALVMFLTQGMSGSIKCVAEDCRLQGSSLYVRVKEISPSMHTMDLRYNTLAASVPHSVAEKIKSVRIESYRVDV